MWSSSSGTATWTTFSAWPRLPMRRCPTAVTERAGALLLTTPPVFRARRATLARVGVRRPLGSAARMLHGVVLPDLHAINADASDHKRVNSGRQGLSSLGAASACGGLIRITADREAPRSQARKFGSTRINRGGVGPRGWNEVRLTGPWGGLWLLNDLGRSGAAGLRCAWRRPTRKQQHLRRSL